MEPLSRLDHWRHVLAVILSLACSAAIAAEHPLAEEPQEELAANPETISAEPLYSQTSPTACLPAGASCDCLSCDGCCPLAGCGYGGGPRYYARAEALFLSRSNDSSNRALLEDVNFNTILSADNLGFDNAPGARILFGVVRGPCDCCSAWEFEYLGGFNWDNTRVVTDPGNVFGAGDLGTVNGFSPADQVHIDYSSSLNSFEANCVKCLCEDCCTRVETLWGLRYVSLNEDLTLSSNNVAPINAVYDIDADNDLFGLNVGGRVTRKLGNGWRAQLIGKAGIYYNHSDVGRSLFEQIPPGVNVPVPNGDEDGVAFLGEIQLAVSKQLTRRWSVRGGYNLLWIDGVALAPDQVITNGIFTTPPGTVNQNGGLFAHGASVGLETVW